MNYGPVPTAETVAPRPVASPVPPGTAEAQASFGWVFSWTARGGLAILDQGLFAGSHFALNVLLARWLTPADYGAFAVAHAVFLLAAGLHSALLIEPMTVFGSGKYFAARHGYLGILLRGHLVLVLPAALLLLGAAGAVYMNSPAVGHSLAALACVLPLLLANWVTRRAFYLELRPGWAAAGGVVYAALLLGSTVWLHEAGFLSPATAFLTLGSAAGIVSLIQLACLHPRWSLEDDLTLAQVTSEHWRYGRWALWTAVAGWFSVNLYYLFLPASLGLAEAGALRALLNLANPVGHVWIALSALLLPLLVRHSRRGGLSRVRRTIGRALVLATCGGSIYLAFLLAFRSQILELLYAGKYLEHAGWPMLWVGCIPLVAAFTAIFAATLRALERPDMVFWSVLAATAPLLVGFPLAAHFGSAGALGGVFLSNGVTALILFVFLKRLERKSDFTFASTDIVAASSQEP